MSAVATEGETLGGGSRAVEAWKMPGEDTTRRKGDEALRKGDRTGDRTGQDSRSSLFLSRPPGRGWSHLRAQQEERRAPWVVTFEGEGIELALAEGRKYSRASRRAIAVRGRARDNGEC